MPDGARIRLVDVGRKRVLEYLAPAPEAHQREERQHVVVLQDPRAAIVASGTAGGWIGCAGRGEGRGAAPVHRGGSPQEMPVVRDVADAVRALRIDLRDVAVVRRDRPLVGRDRLGVATGAHVDVRRHVQQVPGTRHEAAQPVGARLRLARDAPTTRSGGSSSGSRRGARARSPAPAPAARESPPVHGRAPPSCAHQS